jgi:hypothetical protein
MMRAFLPVHSVGLFISYKQLLISLHNRYLTMTPNLSIFEVPFKSVGVNYIIQNRNGSRSICLYTHSHSIRSTMIVNIPSNFHIDDEYMPSFANKNMLNRSLTGIYDQSSCSFWSVWN